MTVKYITKSYFGIEIQAFLKQFISALFCVSALTGETQYSVKFLLYMLVRFVWIALFGGLSINVRGYLTFSM